ncbi:MAG: hypothetical protein H0S80_00365 [Desulfovibrionaceae bacterium]|nr:hypothetical protein [Desulfovibrionaceae bacterium]
MSPSSLYYDANDYKLLEILNDLIQRGVDRSHFKTILEPYLRPHGIKELAADPGLRIAYAIMHLLQSLKSDQARDRIKAINALRDETLAAARGSMRNNRARVLVQIGKGLIRAQGNEVRQLELAHDFRRAAAGKVGFLRRQLRKYHLLEMPEEWNQIAFDDRVHDANSKGRKSATHLIMDAWVKGIRDLTVVYYNFMEPAVARELFASARILDVTARIGIEFQAMFRDRYVKIVWGPNGVQDDGDIEEFFRQDQVRELMRLGQEVQALRTAYVKAVTQAFNKVHRESIRQEFGISLPPLDYADVRRAIGSGQPSIFHLGNYIHETAMPLFAERVEALRREYMNSDYDAKAAITMQVESLDALDADTIIARYLLPEENPDIPNPDMPSGDNVPELLRLSPAELTSRLRGASPSSSLTLILSDLDLADVIEILYDCQGRISHFEVFNTKSLTELQARQRRPFSQLQQAINEQNAVVLKRMIRNRIKCLQGDPEPSARDREARLEAILPHFSRLLDRYRRTPLKAAVGSGSTGRSSRAHGMGFAVAETLPFRAQRELRHRPPSACIPIAATAMASVEFIPPRRSVSAGCLTCLICTLPGFRALFCRTRHWWRLGSFRVDTSACGDVVTLGGISQEGNGLRLFDEHEKRERKRPAPAYLNTSLKNALKVLAGFVPAFLTFYLTKDWWVLAYLGGLIWFFITGFRNVIQSVLGGGGLRRSQYLAWNDYVSWDRIADSLLYTGFSVPLLDWLCKSVFLDRGLGITTTTDPLMLYTIMALTNGIYISGHNIFRGLPRKAALANFFRSILSIPVAIALNEGVGFILHLSGVGGVAAMLQLWAAVISKLASDFVAGIIEGLADRSYNISMRDWDYTEKIRQVFELFTQLEILFPTRNMLDVLRAPSEFIELSRSAGRDHVPAVMANALDLLYIWAYKPRSGEALRRAMEQMTADEQDVFVAAQQILREEKEVATLFVNGLVGRNFSKALSFYLLRYRSYLDELEAMAGSMDRKSGAEECP